MKTPSPPSSNPYVLSLIQRHGDPIRRQFVPSPRELEDSGPQDPLGEEKQSPCPGIIHRYPDRVVFLVENRCAVYCRYCMRKRRVGGPAENLAGLHRAGLDYIRNNPKIREVILSGGDPLVMDDQPLFTLMEELSGIPHVEILRIHSRVPGVLPQRITPELAQGLARFSPVFVNIQFNHPRELTPEVHRACALLADAGIPLGSQTVLLARVNDDARIQEELFRGLLALRVRPYYLHQLDRVAGTRHFQVPLNKGLRIMERLRGRISGMAVPQFMVDLPGGGGKIPCLPEYSFPKPGKEPLFRNFQGKIFK